MRPEEKREARGGAALLPPAYEPVDEPLLVRGIGRGVPHHEHDGPGGVEVEAAQDALVLPARSLPVEHVRLRPAGDDDALVNDRPTVCVLYDEGAPPGESWAVKNVSGEHYRRLMASAAFYRAAKFEDVVAGIERGLAQPGELAQERAQAAREVVGEVDGRAAERVVDAIVAAVD